MGHMSCTELSSKEGSPKEWATARQFPRTPPEDPGTLYKVWEASNGINDPNFAQQTQALAFSGDREFLSTLSLRRQTDRRTDGQTDKHAQPKPH